MKNILDYLYAHKTFSKEEAKEVLENIALGKYNSSQIASFLTVFIMRNITLDELIGFREALLSLCHKVDLSTYNPMDVCGTGGDGKNTFNISTLTSFVVAGAGIPVAKHGNYGVSSVSGSSNVLESLGVAFPTDNAVIENQIKEANITFLHAPLFHPAMKTVGPIRKELGVKTFFNMLGPLVNPAEPKVQMSGVFSLELARMYHYILQNNNSNYSIIYGLDGFDEITLTDSVKIIQNDGEHILNASHFQLPKVNYDQLFGGNTVAEATEIFTTIINGKGTTSQNNVVLSNAALAIQTYHQNLDFQEAFELAKISLFEQKAKQSLNILTEIR
ncbi:anthranilate phosphoribosyltransferase [Flavobacterium dankookense]|uniref:Anthranilate phosphoribosyltransferase n=1 Tax=Flavobacterium dankookense TaxID=706186 RepID=A0A4R6QB70_9FLAO|nr:anthranilate phosphoribosyltransferase [Flavobacterium dankookense]TDP59898.1 anthranilate phosphoribosyltransferase [Flavobacterium dankookense]